MCPKTSIDFFPRLIRFYREILEKSVITRANKIIIQQLPSRFSYLHRNYLKLHFYAEN